MVIATPLYNHSLDKMATSSTGESVRRRNFRTSSVRRILQSLHEEFLDLPLKDLVSHLFKNEIIDFELKQRINSRDVSGKEANDLLFDHLYSSRTDEESLLKLCDIMDNPDNKHLPPAVRDFSKTLKSALNKNSELPPRHHTPSIEPPDSEKSRHYVPDRNENLGSKESFDDDRKSLTDMIESDHNLQPKDELSRHASSSDSSLNILSTMDSLGSSSQIPASLQSDPESRTSGTSEDQVSSELEYIQLLDETKTLREEVDALEQNEVKDVVVCSECEEQLKKNSHLKQSYLERKEWSESIHLPWGMACLSAVEVDNRLYVGGGYTGRFGCNSDVRVLEKDCKHWSKLPSTPHPTCHFGLASCCNQLYLVGGRYTSWTKRISLRNMSDRVYLYDVEKWKSNLPNLNQPREYPGVVGIKTHIVVAGGSKQMVSCSIEIIDTSSPCPVWWEVKHWHKMVYPQVVVNTDHLYLGGDRIGCIEAYQDYDDLTKLYSIPVDTLLGDPEDISIRSWKSKLSLPYASATMATYNNHLIAIGGYARHDLQFARSEVSVLHPPCEWRSVSRLPQYRYGAAAVNVKNGIFVCGGFSKYGAYMNRFMFIILLMIAWLFSPILPLLFIMISCIAFRRAFSLLDSSDFLAYIW